MSEKTLKTIAGVVAALIVLYVAATLLSGAPRSVDGGPMAAALERAGKDAREIRILAGGDTIELRRETAGWTVDGHPADSSLVSGLLRALREARIGHLAASSAANHDRLGVSDSAARVLEVGTGSGAPVRILVGNAGPSYDAVYLRLAGRDEVFLVHGSIRRHTLRSAEDWRAEPEPETAESVPELEDSTHTHEEP
jgi:hypothetical protein